MSTRPDSGAEWVMRMRRNALSTAERKDIAHWLDASPDNARDFLRAEAAWRLSGVLEADESVKQELAELDRMRTVLAAQRPADPRGTRRSPWIHRSIAAAASIAIAAVSAWFFLTPRQYQTARGEQRIVTLSDGSMIALNTDTRLSVDLSSDHRIITLNRGEALFEVARDPRRPFIVRAGRGYTRVLGTRFNVVAQHDGASVSVLEGRVEVVVDQQAHLPQPSLPGSPSKVVEQQARVLNAGQSTAYTAAGRLVAAEPLQVSLERIAAWRDGKLRFESLPLNRAVREYNRYAKKPIRLEVDSTANIPISGVFRIGDSATFVQALGELVGAGVTDEGDELLLRSPAK